MADNSNNWMTQKQKEYEGQNKPYTPPYKGNTLAGDIGNLASNFLNQEKQGYKEFGDYIQKSKDATSAWANGINNYVVDNWDESRRQIGEDAKYIFGSPESNNSASLKSIPTPNVIHVDNPGTVSVSNAGEKPTGPVAFDKQGALDYANSVREKLGQNDATQGATQGTKSAGGTQTNQTTNQTSTNTPTFSSVEEVVYYLAQQPGWNNLTEEQRVAMVDDLWSRQVAATGQTTQDTTSEESNTKGSLGDGYTEDVMNNMKSELQTNTSGDIYGKTTGDSSTAITTNADANSAFNADIQARIARVGNVITQNPYSIAAAIAGGFNPYGEQVMRDIATYAPDYYNQIQTELKNIKAGKTVNAIASGTSLPDSGASEISSINNGMDMWAEAIGKTPQQTSYTIQNAQDAMNNNMVATTATQEILNINKQIESINTKMNNIEKEANTVFKGDASQELVNAFMNNRRQQYLQDIKELEGRRTSALDIYKMEVENYKWGVEMANKDRQFNQDVENEMWDRWYKTQQMNKANVHWENGKAYQVNDDGTITQLTDATALKNYQNEVNSTISMYKSRYTAGGGTKTATGYKYGYCGLECEGLTDNFTEMTTGLTMLPRDENGNIIQGRTWTYAQEKMAYCKDWIPAVGMIAVGVGGVYDSTYGHTMIVTGWDPNTQMVELLWSNKDGDKTVYSTTDTLSNLYAKGLYGFWDPYKDMVESSARNGTYGYNENGVLITPMTATFDSLIDNSSSGADREAVAAAERAYSTLYEILNDGSLSELITSGDMGKVRNVISKADFANTKDDEGFTFKNMLQNYLETKAAKEFSGGDASMSALRKLIELVETKLRDESGAVINSGEWKSNFRLFIPMPGESEDYMWDKMGDWDNIITKSLRKGGMLKATDYIPLFPKSSNRETW